MLSREFAHVRVDLAGVFAILWVNPVPNPPPVCRFPFFAYEQILGCY